MEENDDTPLMRQYRSVKEGTGDAVLFFRLGDFYEMFDDDAKEVSRLLNLTLTHHRNRPMCGIPFHAAKIYISRLLRLGKKVAVCEQIGEVTGKTLAERKVVEIITPGTAVDGSYLDGGQNNFLACICISKRGVGFAFLDITTADFFATHWKTSEMSEAFARELSRAKPRELLLPESLKKNSEIQSEISGNPQISVSYYPDWDFEQKKSFENLKAQFGVQNLKSFSLEEDSPEVAPAGFLLEYISRTIFADAPHISALKVYRDNQFLMMDDSSRRNLEITANLRDGSTSFSLLESLGTAKTAMGKRLLRKWLLYPLLDSQKIAFRQDKIEDFAKNRNLLDFVQEKLSDILDIERLAGRIAMERAHAKDLQALRASLESWAQICAKIGEDAQKAVEIAQIIEESIHEDPSTSLSEGRLIRAGFSSKIDELHELHDNAGKILEGYAQQEREKTGIFNLKIKHTDVLGFFIEIPRGKTEKSVPDYFVLRRALANCDRYTTDRLSEIEKEIVESGAKIIESEKNLFLEIRAHISKEVPYLLETAQKIAFEDCTSTLAKTAVLKNWVRPIVDNSGLLQIQDGRHPIVESSLPEGEFVSNDSLLTSDSDEKIPAFVILTGPNMAGKSTYLRQTAIIVLLAQIGSFVPAKTARVGIVDRIFCRVGASDNLARGESTFLVEMTETAFILRNATKKSLVIMDEVGRGTSTEDGLSIAWAVSEHLLNSVCCKTLFATHYHELTRMNHARLSLFCMAVSDSGGKVVFLRKVKSGASENSYGIHVASMAGVPLEVISRAEQILAGLQSAKENGSNVVIETSHAKIEKNAPKMPGLFSDEELILDEILTTDTDGITPRDALALISRWQDTLMAR